MLHLLSFARFQEIRKLISFYHNKYGTIKYSAFLVFYYIIMIVIYNRQH